MISKRFKTGKTLVLPANVFTPAPFVATNTFDTHAPIPLNVQHSVGGGFFSNTTKTSSMVPGAVATADRNLQWLHYLPGNIANIAFNGTDVLTGKMSGCPLVVYRPVAGGLVHAGHIGTIVGDAVTNAAVLGNWNAWATANPLNIIAGYNPAGIWNVPPTGNTGNGWGILGLLTAGHHHLYSIFIYATGAANTWRVAGKRKVPSMTVAQLQNL